MKEAWKEMDVQEVGRVRDVVQQNGILSPIGPCEPFPECLLPYT